MESSLETSPIDDELELNPGDQVLFKVKSNRGDDVNIWGRVIKNRTSSKVKNVHSIVIDEWLLIDMPPRYHPGAVISITLNDIVGHIPLQSKAVLHIEIQNEEVIKITRIDGNVAPIIVSVDEDDMEMLYSVDHKGWRSI